MLPVASKAGVNTPSGTDFEDDCRMELAPLFLPRLIEPGWPHDVCLGDTTACPADGDEVEALPLLAPAFALSGVVMQMLTMLPLTGLVLIIAPRGGRSSGERSRRANIEPVRGNLGWPPLLRI